MKLQIRRATRHIHSIHGYYEHGRYEHPHKAKPWYHVFEKDQDKPTKSSRRNSKGTGEVVPIVPAAPVAPGAPSAVVFPLQRLSAATVTHGRLWFFCVCVSLPVHPRPQAAVVCLASSPCRRLAQGVSPHYSEPLLSLDGWRYPLMRRRNGGHCGDGAPRVRHHILGGRRCSSRGMLAPELTKLTRLERLWIPSLTDLLLFFPPAKPQIQVQVQIQACDVFPRL